MSDRPPSDTPSTPTTTTETTKPLLFDLTKILEQFKGQFKLPEFDVQAFVAARQADVDALAKANAAALAGAQRIADHQAEILKNTLDELGNLLQGLSTSASDVKAVTNEKREAVQAAVTRALASMKELAEATRQSQTEVFDVVSKRAKENVADLKKMLKAR